MSWIKDVQKEIWELDVSRRKLREFGLLVGGVLVGFGAFIFWRKGAGLGAGVLAGAGAFLMLLGWVVPVTLRDIYKFWMGAALAIAWPVARVVLAIFFFLVVTPISLIGRAFGAKFLELDKDEKRTTFWIPRRKVEKVDYEKMF